MKKILVILLVIGILCFCVLSICGGVTYSGVAALTTKSDQIKEQVLIDLCETHGTMMTSDQYDKWFSMDFKEETDYSTSQVFFVDVFPTSMSCDTLKSTGFFDMISKGQQISSVYENGASYYDIQFKNSDGVVYTARFVDQGGTYKMYGIQQGIVE